MLAPLLRLILATELVEVSVDECAALDAAEVRRIVKIELASGPQTPVPITVHVGCAGALLVLDVDDPLAKRRLSRTLGVREVPVRARPRTVALAIAELLSASWSELSLRPPDPQTPPAEPLNAVPPSPPASEPPPAPAPPTEVSAVRAPQVQPGPDGSTSARFSLHGFASARWLTTSATTQWGAGASARWAGERWGVAVELGAETGARSHALGTLQLTSGSAAAAALAFFRPAERWVVQLSLGARAGAASITGTPKDAAAATGATLSGGWAGPLAGACGSFLPSRTLVLGLCVEAGYPIAQVTGSVDGARVLGLDGPWVTAQASVGVAP